MKSPKIPVVKATAIYTRQIGDELHQKHVDVDIRFNPSDRRWESELPVYSIPNTTNLMLVFNFEKKHSQRYSCEWLPLPPESQKELFEQQNSGTTERYFFSVPQHYFH